MQQAEKLFKKKGGSNYVKNSKHKKRNSMDTII